MNKAVSPAQTIYPALSDAIVKSAFALVVTVVLASRLLVNKRALTALKADFSWLKLVVSSLVEAVTVFSELEESVFSELDVLLELVFAEEDELLEVLVELFELFSAEDCELCFSSAELAEELLTAELFVEELFTEDEEESEDGIDEDDTASSVSSFSTLTSKG